MLKAGTWVFKISVVQKGQDEGHLIGTDGRNARKRYKLRINILFPCLSLGAWLLDFQFSAASVNWLLTSSLRTPHYLTPPYSDKPTPIPAWQERSGPEGIMACLSKGVADTVQNFEYSFTRPPSTPLRCWLLSTENRTTAILNIFPFHGIIVARAITCKALHYDWLLLRQRILNVF